MKAEIIEADGDRGYYDRCWCSGRKRVWFSTMFLSRSCHGHGMLHCDCGGDFCVCHNHGEVECFGCADCDPADEEWDDEEWDDVPDVYEPVERCF